MNFRKYTNESYHSEGTVTDVDGNAYNTVKIGTQVWTTSNLRATRLNTGYPLALIGNLSDQEPGYCWPPFLNGALYNWPAASLSLAPKGWRIPSKSDWLRLIVYLGGRECAGGKLKSTLKYCWDPPNIGATNSSGFSAKGVGFRYQNGEYYGVGKSACFWSSDYSYVHLETNSEIANYSVLGQDGCSFSIRLVRDF